MTDAQVALVTGVSSRRTLVAASILALVALQTASPAAIVDAPDDTAVLTVTITGARSAYGRLGIAVFATERGFPEEESQALRQATAIVDPATSGARVTFRDLPFGTYAVGVRHDENQNGRLDKNLLGIPKEGYGVSNTPPPRLRAPRFDEAAIRVSVAELAITIRLIYR